MRASFLALKEKEFVEAARCVGVPSAWLIVRHILPNALSPVIVAATLGVGSAILAESSISFLGLGVSTGHADMGPDSVGCQIIWIWHHTGRSFPGLMIFLAVISINYIGDGLRDALDPRKIL